MAPGTGHGHVQQPALLADGGRIANRLADRQDSSSRPGRKTASHSRPFARWIVEVSPLLEPERSAASRRASSAGGCSAGHGRDGTGTKLGSDRQQDAQVRAALALLGSAPGGIRVVAQRRAKDRLDGPPERRTACTSAGHRQIARIGGRRAAGRTGRRTTYGIPAPSSGPDSIGGNWALGRTRIAISAGAIPSPSRARKFSGHEAGQLDVRIGIRRAAARRRARGPCRAECLVPAGAAAGWPGAGSRGSSGSSRSARRSSISACGRSRAGTCSRRR